MLVPIKFGIGSPLGSGDQYMNWVHWKDVVHIFHHFLLNDDLNGTFNVVAPYPETNKKLTRLIAE